MQPLVFLPGTLCDERVWTYQVAEFPTSSVVNLRTQSSVEEMLESVRKVPLESFVLVGFSMGGYVAQEFALSHPARVKHLVLLGSSALGYPTREREIVVRSRPMIEKGLFKGITDKRLRDFLHPKAYARRELRELIQAMAGEDAAQVYLRQIDATIERRDLSAKLGKLACPLTAIGGREDAIVPYADILSFERWVRGADVYILPECGHFSPLEKPQEVNRILHSIAG